MKFRGIEIYSLLQAKLLDEFTAALKGWDWDTWCAAGASDKEEVAATAIAELGLQIGIEEAYDLFWEWANTLTSDDFISDPNNFEDEEEDYDEEVQNWNDQFEDPRYVDEE